MAGDFGRPLTATPQPPIWDASSPAFGPGCVAPPRAWRAGPRRPRQRAAAPPRRRFQHAG
eukprot:scaffold93179_cov72-Phaeocystis_antarctica.AAC.5